MIFFQIFVHCCVYLNLSILITEPYRSSDNYGTVISTVISWLFFAPFFYSQAYRFVYIFYWRVSFSSGNILLEPWFNALAAFNLESSEIPRIPLPRLVRLIIQTHATAHSKSRNSHSASQWRLKRKKKIQLAMYYTGARSSRLIRRDSFACRSSWSCNFMCRYVKRQITVIYYFAGIKLKCS